MSINIVNGHCTLIVVNMYTKKMWYLDSCSGPGTRYVDVMRRYMQDEYRSQKKEDMSVADVDKWNKSTTTDPSQQVPQQHNSKDCGAFVCMFSFALTNRLPVEFFTQKYIPFFRRHIALSIFNCRVCTNLKVYPGWSVTPGFIPPPDT